MPTAETAPRIACVPYDVPYESEVREEISRNPFSFLRVTRPEAEFPPDSRPPESELFRKSKINFEAFLGNGTLVQTSEPSIYLYRLTDGPRSQTGIVACCSIDEYDAGSIKKHERTRPDKVYERTEHMFYLRAQTGLIFLAFRSSDGIRKAIDEETGAAPLFSFVSRDDRVEQTVWKVRDPERLVREFSYLSALYIADGHHRAESASECRRRLKAKNPHHTGNEEYNFVMAGVFPAEELTILPYNRLIKDLNGNTREDLIRRLSDKFVVTESFVKTPENPGQFAMYLAGKWYVLKYNVDFIRDPGPIERLDANILQENVLSPILGIADPRTDKRISFVGGRRGTTELERLVDSGEYAVAFSLYPTSIEDLIAVADIDEIMPPKSTWFEPKLKDGLFIHRI
ncbi:MAG: DUF1015 domain-containing protein [Blastocatellia bacterium]